MRLVRSGSVVVVALLVAACDVAPAVRTLAVTAPAAPVEVVPVAGEGLSVAWRFDAERADEIEVTVALAPVADGAEVPLSAATLAAGAVLWPVPAAPPEPGVYRALVRATLDGEVLAEAAAPGLVVMQGVRFRDAELTFTSDPTTRDLWLTTVVASESRALLYLAPTIDGPRRVFADAVIASDLAPVGRVVTFTGAAVDGTAIPPGDHQAFVEVRTRGDSLRYQRGGLLVHWRP